MREYLLSCKRTGEPPRLMPEEHIREKVLCQIRQWLEAGPPECTDVLWIIPENITIDKGIYAWNQAGVDMEIECYLAVVAQAPLMAFIMGEYDLARQWYTRYGREPEEEVVELCYSKEASYVECGSYTLEMAWMLAQELGETEGFFERMCTNYKGLEHFRDSLHSFCFQWGHTYDEETPVRRFCQRRQKGDRLDRVIPFLVSYILWKRMDLIGTVWKELMEAFSCSQERNLIVNAVHAFWDWSETWGKLAVCDYMSSEDARMEKLLEVYGEYEKTLFMCPEIEQYLARRVTEKKQGRDSLKYYFWAVEGQDLHFTGAVTEGWKQLMCMVLRMGDADLLSLCFQCGFLRQELADEYLKECDKALDPACRSQVAPLLMGHKWQIWDRTGTKGQKLSVHVKLYRCIHNLKCTYSRLDYPLTHMRFIEGSGNFPSGTAFYTDGLRIYYSPKRVEVLPIQELEYGIMHILMHGLLGHFLRSGLFHHQDIIGQIMDAQVLYALHQIGGDVWLKGREKEGIFTIRHIFHHEISLLAYDEIMGSGERQADMIVYVNHGRYDDHRPWSREYAKLKAFWQEMIEVVFGRECSEHLENTEKAMRTLETLVFARIEAMRKEE